MLVDLVQNTIEGLANGSAYALIALGFTLIFGVVGRLNLAYGATIMIGLYAGIFVHAEWQAGWMVVAATTLLGSVAAGIYVERLCFAPMRQGAAITAMVASFAIWMQLEEVATLGLPRHSYPFPPLVTGPAIEIGPFLLRREHLFMLVVALVVMVALEWLVRASRFGLALRAIAENPRAARFVGHNVERSLFLAFMLASAVGGVAGWLIASTDQQVTAMFGMWATFKGLVAAMLGGLGSLSGAVIGGLLLGVVEAYALWTFGPQVRDLSAYLILFLLLVLRPGGLLGQVHALRDADTRRRL
ncbi:branched-chain amino acid ABC transporter permease [Mesorhizobium sp. CN2-181]|uniref:branched-chain amino acid ABC transporter permease n=1 Tax=Mesorhizobium yinganensis TaxID=3157707 RepID=UPI0032B84A9E